MNHKAVLFDLDGTLLDSLDDLADSMNAVLQRFGFTLHDRDAYKGFIGDGMINLVRRALPEEARINEPMVTKCFEAMREDYGGRWKTKTHPYEGVPELLNALSDRQIKLAILSNKPDDFTRIAVRELLPSWKFEAVVGERPNVQRKPHPGAAIEIASLLSLPPNSFLFLGDTGIDMQTANSAGMVAIGAMWGFRKAEELLQNGAEEIIEHPLDLLKFL
jgi:phosphoglycolate phosphatase